MRRVADAARYANERDVRVKNGGAPVNRKTIIFVSVSVLGILLDQITKYWVRANLALHVDEINVIPDFFSLVHAENPGAAGGFLRNFEYRQYVFLGFTVVAISVIINLWRSLPSAERFMSFTLGLILSGAIGNAIDRVHKQTVTDFLRVYTENASLKPWLIERFGTNEWPSFNVADSALVVGVSLFMIHYLFIEEKEGAKATPEASTAAPPDAPDAPQA